MSRFPALAAVLVAVAAAAAPGPRGPAHAQTAACSGLLPMGMVQPPVGDFQIGCAYVYQLKLDPDVSSGGNFGFVDFPPCDAGPCGGMPPTGETTVRCLMANGYGCCVEIGQVLDTEPGNTGGPFLQGLQDRWDADSDQRGSICFAAYLGNGMRLLSVLTSTPGFGATTVQVTGFMTGFLVSRPGSSDGSPVEIEFQPPGVVAVPPATWGRIKTLYRD